MKQPNNLSLGSSGETIAVQYLQSLGWKMVTRNFKKRYAEIDIIAYDGKTLVFVEVKTRKGNEFGEIEETITPWKIKTLIRSVRLYLHLHPGNYESLRIDFLGIELDFEDKPKDISLYKNISVDFS